MKYIVTVYNLETDDPSEEIVKEILIEGTWDQAYDEGWLYAYRCCFKTEIEVEEYK